MLKFFASERSVIQNEAARWAVFGPLPLPRLKGSAAPLAAYLRGGRARLSQLPGADKLIAMVKDPVRIARYLAAAGELIDVPSCAPARGPSGSGNAGSNAGGGAASGPRGLLRVGRPAEARPGRVYGQP